MDDNTAVNVRLNLNRKKNQVASLLFHIFGREVRDLICAPLPLTQVESRSKQLRSNLRFITEFT